MTTITRPQGLIHADFPSLRRVAAAWADRRAARRERNRIARELNTYSDRELMELGLFRHDIPSVADGTYRR